MLKLSLTAGIASFLLATPALAQTQTCTQVETTYPEWQAATIVGEEPGSRVNVRPEPSLNSSDGSYGLVGEAIAVIATLETTDCQTWHKVWFPESGWQGWAHSRHVRIDHK